MLDKDKKKIELGQFFTKKTHWLLPHIIEYIKSKKVNIAYDPFVGDGDLLVVMKELGFTEIIGLDIDPINNKWKYNDSLINIPKIDNSIIITNPPYLTNYSAKRKNIYQNVEKYFSTHSYDDIYQIAIEKCLVNDYGIMIIPETFINSTFPKDRLHSITILENNLFHDTETPVCVICFDKKSKPLDQVKVYKNDVLLNSLEFFNKQRLKPKNNLKIKFNDIEGEIALRAVDTTDPLNKIAFMNKKDLNYKLTGIKPSSRLITIIKIDHDINTELLIKNANQILNKIRKTTQDVIFSPFKGNRKDGVRRRRLDYKTARAILEKAYKQIYI